MGTERQLCGEQVTLTVCTRDFWHAFYKAYVCDPMMDSTPYTYAFEQCDKLYVTKTSDPTRKYFAILHQGQPAGCIYLKRMDVDKKISEFGIAMADDSVKNRGLGSEAIKLLVDYSFQVLGLETILADSVQGNMRSQHVLTKAGFVMTHEDDRFRYYRLDRDSA